jgi:phage protein U
MQGQGGFMRLRITVLACALTALACTAAPSFAGAAPVHNRGLTIHAVPQHIIAGEAVLIFGQLKGPDHANQLIRLYHRINPNPQFTLIGIAKTNANGQYEFTRQEGIVDTNRSWFVRGPGFTHSRTVHERVDALVSLAASSATGLTRHPLVFSGHVTPDHTGGIVALQQQRGTSDDWRTIDTARIGPGSNYTISHAWRIPGAYTVRVKFPGDARNMPAVSDAQSVVIEQTEVPDFTIQTSDPIVPNEQAVTISGVLDSPGTTTPEPNTSVSLLKKLPGSGGPYQEVTTATTGTDGSYSFPNVTSGTNELYLVRTTFAPHRHTAVLFQGVQDVVQLFTSSSTSTVDGHITFSGTVSPDKGGHVVYLQKLGKDDDWHNVEARFVDNASTFQFGWTFGTAGTKEFRARITGGPVNIGGASAPLTIVVSQPPLSTLPTS